MQPQQLGAPRIFLYAHDSFGLGHLRRTLTLAEAFVGAFPHASVLLVTGSPAATFFPVPTGVDLVKLPCITKDAAGEYVPRSLRSSFRSILHLRRSILLECFRSFAPDLLLVDHQVTGLRGEMLPILREARAAGTKTLLGVRDIIDEPPVVAREWGTEDCRWALLEAYDRVCVYGVPEVFDPRREYPIPAELSRRMEFTGYVVRKRGTNKKRALPKNRAQVLVTTGGGEDGADRIESYLDGLEVAPARFGSTIVIGPLLDAGRTRRLRRRARKIRGVQVHRSHADLPKLLEDSSAVVCMAGYNTCAEVLASGRPAVLLPRVRPRREQALRADRLEQRGLALSLIEPTPEEIRSAVEATIDGVTLRGSCPDLGGAQRMCRIAKELLDPRTRQSRRLECGRVQVLVS